MRLKLLLTLGFVLFLSTLASSNECARYTAKCGDTGKCETGPVKKAQSAQSAKTAQSIQPAGSIQSAKPAAAAPRAVTADTESSTLVINKLLYI